MRVLHLSEKKIAVMDKLCFYVRIAYVMMEKCLPFVESSFTRVFAHVFRAILSQEGFAVERGADVSSDDNDSLCVVEGDEKEEDIEIDDDVYL